jgi:hypothetical protein
MGEVDANREDANAPIARLTCLRTAGVGLNEVARRVGVALLSWCCTGTLSIPSGVDKGFASRPNRFYFDQSCMYLPIDDTFELSEPFFRRLDRFSLASRRSNRDRALAAAEELTVSGNFVNKTYAIALHYSLPKQSIIDAATAISRAVRRLHFRLWRSAQPRWHSSSEAAASSGRGRSLATERLLLRDAGHTASLRCCGCGS